MPRPLNPIPSYRLHRQSGQAVVTIRTPDGGRKDILLGRYNSPESKAEYERILAELRTGPAAAARLGTTGRGPADLTVNELLLHFLKWAEGYFPPGSGELTTYKLSARPVRELYGHTLCREFGPLALKTVRERFIAAGLSRKEVNRRVRVVKRAFKWGVAEELIPAVVFHALSAVEGLKKGRTPARECEPIRPADPAAVEATLPFLPADVAGLVAFQRYTGCRLGEACRVRPCDLDHSGPVWVYRPAGHKTAYRGKSRAIAVGPKAQQVLERFWPADPSDYCFSPARAVAAFHAERTRKRATPKYPSHLRRNADKRTPAPKRPPAPCYTAGSYSTAVRRGVEKLNVKLQADAEAAGRAGEFQPVPAWRPNQLRHLYGTLARRRFGLEGAQVALGHAKADVTQVYAEADLELAATVAADSDKPGPGSCPRGQDAVRRVGTGGSNRRAGPPSHFRFD